MSDLPELIQALSDTDQSAEILMGGAQFATPAALLAAYPALAEPGNAPLLARAVTHFAQAGQFHVIEDPAAFRAAYEARLASEDPKRPWAQDVFRLVDYGVPDFAEIAPPAISDGRLVFHAADDLIGLPYRVEARLDPQGLAEPHFEPMPLTPVPGLGPDEPRPAAAGGAQPGQVSPADDIPTAGDAPPEPTGMPVAGTRDVPPAGTDDPDDIPR